jgi:uncharacterized protein YceH (UPF0502 family)
MDVSLNEQEIRVLGCLMEKSMATPDYYPLSLNALTNACNQKSNRDPVVNWDEEAVLEALAHLEEMYLINESTVGRVPKYEELLTRKYNLVGEEAAVLCVLFLRGPQTPGAIRSRTDRLHAFDSLDTLQETLSRLSEWGHIRQLPRLPGHKESRYTHLLGGKEKEIGETPDDDIPMAVADETDRLELLEKEIQAVRSELKELQNAFESFRKQFE